jgi:uncharacterized protein (TIGR02145 family)
MRKFGMNNVIASIAKQSLLAFFLAIAFVACGDDKGSSPNELPDEVADMDELEEYKCDDSVSGAVVYVKSKRKKYECDGNEWSVSQNQSKSSSSTKSSSSSEQSIAIKEPCNIKTDENCFEDSRDGQTYRITKIAGQIWMAENLNYKVEGSYCYNDSVEYCKKYGRLYTRAAAMDSAGVWSLNGKGCGYGDTCVPVYPVRGVCPEGWHLPKYKEFSILLDSTGRPTATRLKSASGWNDYKGQSGNGSDDYGFSALPAGLRGNSESYGSLGRYANFWSSSERDRRNTYILYMYDNDSTAFMYYVETKKLAASIRCINDKSDSVNFLLPCKTDDKDDCEYGSLTDDRDGQTYKTVRIGNQWWMAVNLNYETEKSYWVDTLKFARKGDAPKCCPPEKKFGRLYSWSDAMDSAGVWSSNGKGCGDEYICVPENPVRGICPEGWHLPTIAEFEILLANVDIGGDGETGTALRSSYGWFDNRNGIDAYGFTALPVGCGGGCGRSSLDASFWSSTDYSKQKAGFMYMETQYSGAFWNYTFKDYSLSVRCLKD